MLQLPNNCRAGEFTVRPKNWKSSSANAKLLWKVQYWFYDDNLSKRLLIVIKGMNRLTTLRGKQDFVKQVIADELDQLQSQGWNPITKKYASPEFNPELSPGAHLTDALTYSFGKLPVSEKTKECIKSCLTCVKQAISQLTYDRMPVKDVKARHVKMILERCGIIKGGWSASYFNHYRSYLLMLFKEMVEMDAIDQNPVREVSKKKQVRRIRKELTKAERKRVREHLSANYPRYYLFVQGFFHSGAREAELLSLQAKDIDIPGQRFKIMIKKGRESREVWKPMKTISVQYWEQVIEGAQPDEYVFAKGWKPGNKRIRNEQPSRRWNVYVKKQLGIEADLYSLKHSNLDEISAAVAGHKEGLKKAGEAADHKGTVITMTYTQGQQEREDLAIKQVMNEF